MIKCAFIVPTESIATCLLTICFIDVFYLRLSDGYYHNDNIIIMINHFDKYCP